MRNPLPFVLLPFFAAAAVAQVPCSQSNLGTNLGLGDEAMSAPQALGFSFVYNNVGYTSIEVCDNGYVALGSGGAANWNVDPATLCNDLFPSIRPLWIDLDPSAAGSGSVYFQAVPASGNTPAYAVVTWDRVYEYFGSTPHSFQLFLIDGGAIRCTYGLDLANATYEWLVGASPGNAAAQNPVSFASLPILTSGNATFHEYNGGGAVPLAGRTYDWTPDGLGGYIVTESLACAGTTAYGTGCVAKFQSFYEQFPTTPSIDLSNTAFQMLFTGTGYLALPSSRTFVAPSGTATNLNLGDDTSATVTLSAPLQYPGGTTPTLEVCSNGFISAIASNGTSYQPDGAELGLRAFPSWNVWRDFICDTSGNVWVEEIAGIVYVTWLNVIGYDGTSPGITPSTFQFQFELATGNVDLVFLAMDTVSVSTWTGGEGWVVGWSPGAGAVDPGSLDLSAQLPLTITTYPVDILPLTLNASAAPAVGTTIQLVSSNVPNNSLFGAVLMGFQQFNPGLPLDNLGMAGCSRYNDGVVTLLFFPQGSTGSVNFNVPQFPGVNVQTQSVVYCPAAGLTTLGAIASGGLELRIN
jgi:hypothetical protein